MVIFIRASNRALVGLQIGITNKNIYQIIDVSTLKYFYF